MPEASCRVGPVIERTIQVATPTSVSSSPAAMAADRINDERNDARRSSVYVPVAITQPHGL